jgi:hypothetical protein
MSSYLAGNLLGRLLISYVIVWLAMLLMSRIDWRNSFRLTRRWYGVTSIATVYGLGLIALVI